MNKSKLVSRRNIILMLSLIAIIALSRPLISNVFADDNDEDENDDEGGELGTVAIGLFAFSTVNIIALYIFRFSKKFFSGEDEKNAERRKKIVIFYQKIRKPLNYIHYVSGLAALIVLFIHGIQLTSSDDFEIIIGWIVAGIYVLYILTGLVIWLKIKPFWSNNTSKKWLNRFHRSIIFFATVIIVHIIHVVVVD